MKIIKEGKDRDFCGTCPICKTIFIYKMEDLENNMQLDGLVRYVKCPSCGRVNNAHFELP